MKRQLIIGLLISIASACQAHEAPKTTTETEKQQSYTSPGKPSAPVTMNYEWLGTPQLGQPITLRLNFSANSNSKDLRIHYTAEGSLNLRATGDETLSLQSEPKPVRELTVIPTREGRHYVNVFVELGGQATSVSIPLQVGKAPSNAQPITQGKFFITPTGEKLINLPAQESVINVGKETP